MRGSVSAVFPAFNDAGTIASQVLVARRALRALTPDFEIVVVNDGSLDHTAEILGELQAVVPELKVIHHPENRGYGAALRAGFAAATKDLVFYTDGDAQFDPREMALLIEALAPGLDYVTGYRTKRHDPWLRVLFGRPYQFFVRFAFGLEVQDIDCDFRLFRRTVLEQVELRESNGSFGIELLKKLQDSGFRFAETRVHHYPRVYGRSQYFTFWRVLRSNCQLFRLWVELVVKKIHRRVPVPASD